MALQRNFVCPHCSKEFEAVGGAMHPNYVCQCGKPAYGAKVSEQVLSDLARVAQELKICTAQILASV